MNAVLKKLQYRGQSPLLLLRAPPEAEALAADFEGQVDTSPAAEYAFVLAFARSLADAEETARDLAGALAPAAIVWVAYPKGTSRRYPTDINRDSGRALFEKHGLIGVSLVALDDDWSAMRYKRA